MAIIAAWIADYKGFLGAYVVKQYELFYKNGILWYYSIVLVGGTSNVHYKKGW